MDFFESVNDSKSGLEKLLQKIPGIGGYLKREERRNTDRVLRETISDRYEEQVKRMSEIQTAMVNEGMYDLLDDMERAVTKMRIFIDGIRTTNYGLSSVFDTVRVDEDVLIQLYEYDLSLLNGVDAVSRAIDNVNASLGTEGMPAALRNLVAVSQESVTLFDRRKDVITGIQ